MRCSKQLPDDRIWDARQVAAYLGRSLSWFRIKLPGLRQRGFPAADPEMGGWDKLAVEQWLDEQAGIRSSPAVQEQAILDAIRRSAQSEPIRSKRNRSIA
jgi:predicted DNA-binding transcriptional regulator AlpA